MKGKLRKSWQNSNGRVLSVKKDENESGSVEGGHSHCDRLFELQ